MTDTYKNKLNRAASELVACYPLASILEELAKVCFEMGKEERLINHNFKHFWDKDGIKIKHLASKMHN